MDYGAVQKAVKDLGYALKLERKPVGVKFLFDEQEFESAEAKKLTGKMAYCVMVKAATKGKSLKAAAENFGCGGGARALGMVELDELSLSGRFYNKLGLYKDLATSKDVQRKMTFCGHRPYGVMVKPVEAYREEPDVVLLVTNPYNGMRIIQGYTHAFGFNTALKMSGNQAVCSECTAFPFETNDLNVSLLCAGTRYKAKWGDAELALGFPFNQLLPIVAGLQATLNPTEPNDKKREIEARTRELGGTVPAIEYDKNYYTGLNPEDSSDES